MNIGVCGGGFRIDLKVRRGDHAAFVFIVRVGVGVVRSVKGHVPNARRQCNIPREIWMRDAQAPPTRLRGLVKANKMRIGRNAPIAPPSQTRAARQNRVFAVRQPWAQRVYNEITWDRIDVARGGTPFR